MYGPGNPGARHADYMLAASGRAASQNIKEITMRKALLVLCSAVALGVVGASVAQANEPTDEYGGSVMPGSMDGVNPVFHPYWFGPAARQAYRAQAGNPYGAY